MEDNPTIGIILCDSKDETIVKYSVLKESEQIFASKYKFCEWFRMGSDQANTLIYNENESKTAPYFSLKLSFREIKKGVKSHFDLN